MFPAGVCKFLGQTVSRAKRFTSSICYPRLCDYVIPRKYFNYMVEQKHWGRSMIFHESMYHSMRIHVIFLAPYFLPCPNFIRPHTIYSFWSVDVDRGKIRGLRIVWRYILGFISPPQALDETWQKFFLYTWRARSLVGSISLAPRVV